MAGSFNNSAWYLLRLKVALMSRTSTESESPPGLPSSPKGEVPVVSRSIELTFGMKMSTGRLGGISNSFLFQESSGIMNS